MIILLWYQKYNFFKNSNICKFVNKSKTRKFSGYNSVLNNGSMLRAGVTKFKYIVDKKCRGGGNLCTSFRGLNLT